MWRFLAILSIAPLVVACSGIALADQGQAKEQLACADIGIDHGSPAFSQCVSDLKWNMWYQTEGPATR